MKRTVDLIIVITTMPVWLLVMALGAPWIVKEWRLGDRGDPFKLRKVAGKRWMGAVARDQVPQMWNVLRGEMSLIGPFPDKVDQRLMYAERDQLRLRVKPGITGLAQIRGRDGITWEQRRLLDVEYVKKHNFWMDSKILMGTVS